HDGGTKMTLQHEGIPAGESLDMTEAGWNESLDRLASLLNERQQG
ncbi:SRPBCC domain-containing protein, partial [Methanoculleus sp.]